MTDRLRHNADLVESLGSAMREGGHGLSAAPLLLRRVLEDDSWREFVTQRGDHVEHQRFEQFVTTQPLKGLGSDLALVRRVVADDLEVVGLLDKALALRPGARTDLSHNVREVDPRQGNSAEQALRRLRKDRPDLHERVLARELSAHAAAVEAGFRPRTATIPIDDPAAIARALRRRLGPEQVAALIAALLSNEHA